MKYLREFNKAVLLNNVSVPFNEIWYKSSNGQIITPYNTAAFGDGVTIVSNIYTSYRGGRGKIKLSGNVTTVGQNAFKNCTTLTNISIPNSVTSIDSSAFDGCTGLTSITIPNSVTSIGYEAFYYCTGLTSVSIGSGVTSIGESAFDSCSGLTSITIPNSVTSISRYAFSYCTGLISFTCEATTPPTLGDYVLNNTNNCPIYVPAASVDTYKAASGWSTYASRIQAIP